MAHQRERTTMKNILLTFCLIVSTLAFADQHGPTYAGMDLSKGNALQMNLCTLKGNKTMTNYNRVFGNYVQWSKKNNAEVFAMRATPIFGGANPADGVSYDFIDMLISSYTTSGDAWTKWLTTEDGQKVAEQWNETADCRSVLNPAFIVYIDQNALSGRDDRVMTINWCTRREGVTWDQINAQHQRSAESLTSEAALKAWTIMFPGLGMRNAPGEFAHIVSYEDANGLARRQNNLANEEGWRRREDYNAVYAQCGGENVYYAEVVNRPGS
jgi:hypothetical protein